ncbi:MFS transporter [Deinococcus deserti]
MAAFFTLGLIQAMYGPAFPMFQARFGVDTGAVGLIASVHFLGSSLAPFLVGLALRQVSARRVVVASLLILAAGVSGVALAPSWGLAVTAAFVGGLGLGGVSACLNAAYAAQGTRPVNLVNAVFGIGSMVSPLLVVSLGEGGLGGPFLAVALSAALTLLVARIWGVPGIPAVTGAGAGEVTITPRLMLVFAVMIGVYVGLEAGYGAWTVRYLDSRGLPGAALVLSGFWGGITLSRVLTGMFGARVHPAWLVIGSAAFVTVCALSALIPLLAPGASVLAGLALGPVFGSMLAWASRVMPARQVPFLLTAGSAGGVLLPFLMGQGVAAFGPLAVPLTLATLGSVLLVLSMLTLRHTRPT